MKKKMSFLVFMILLVFISSCASPIKKQLLSAKDPEFEGRITQISIPFQPKIKPASMRFSNYNISHELRGPTDEIYFFGDYRVSKLGKQLVWDYKITKIRIGSKLIAPKLPIADIRILTDGFNNAQEMEVSLPAFDRTKMPQKQYDETVELMKKGSKSLMVISETTVRTGDVIFRKNLKEGFKGIGNLTDEFEGFEVEAKTHINYILKGYSYFEGKRILVAMVNYYNLIEHHTKKDTIYLNIKGFVLVDPETFHIVKTEELSIFDYNTKEVRVSFSALNIYTAQFDSKY